LIKFADTGLGVTAFAGSIGLRSERKKSFAPF
jgi:hypothetical protein